MKIAKALWNFLITWSEVMAAYRKSQGRHYDKYI